MEILAPAGSYDALLAAVYGGADAVYFGAGNFNARKNAKNFTHEQIKQGVLFCRERGVKTNVVLNTLVSQKELDQALYEAEFFTNAGVSSFIVQDLGLAAALKKCTNIPLCASTQMSCHSIDGVSELENLGFSRVVLARELEKKDITKIVRSSNIEIEVFAHGALCMCYSGQCYMSSVIGARSGNRGLCAQPCRLPYNGGYRLSLKDLCLLEYVKELENIGVSSLKIEGRMKSPEYVYAVTRAYADAKKGKSFSQVTEKELAEIFSRDGFTKGYYLGAVGKEMFGTRPQNFKEKKITIDKTEYKRIGISVQAYTDKDFNVRLSAQTDDDLAAESSFKGQKPDKIKSGTEDVKKAFSRLGGTPYFLKKLEYEGNEVFMPQSLLNAARRSIIDDITAMRRINTNTFTKKTFSNTNKKPISTVFEAQFFSASQIPENTENIKRIWLPLTALTGRRRESITAKLGARLGAVMPRVCEDREYAELEKMLLQLKMSGINDVLCGNIGQINMLRRMGFNIHGDFGLNVFNALSRDKYFNIGLSSLTLSFELNLSQIYDISSQNTGIIAYGRLPFMIMRNCIKKECHKNEFLTDRIKKDFLVTCSFGCRNEIFNADKLWLTDKQLSPVGFERLLFTDESPEEVRDVLDAYIYGKNVDRQEITRGLYQKKV
ncbi:MAG: peptidase U32 [Clostridiales bacterium]|nr:MAG: peptidase U32 [Clostridiales bacterium]